MPVLAFSVAALIALVLRQVVLRVLDRRVTDRPTFLYVLLDAIRVPSILWVLAAALAVAIQTTTLTETQTRWANRAIGVFVIVSLSLVIAAVMSRTITVYGERRKLHFAVAGLSRTLTYVVVFSIAGLILLNQFGLTITPILTALGVGGLAVALALQDTLANFFAGIHILVEEPIALGDFIKLSSGEEGVVKDIGWRTTRIHTPGNNMIVIPNTKITSSTLTNYNLPGRRVTGEVVLMASHDADADRIAELAMDAATETEGVLAEPEPAVLFDPGILPTHLQMKLVVHVPSLAERGGVLSLVRFRIYEKFREEGIPFPIVRN